MTKTETLAAVRDSARNAALYLQSRAGDMTGTELYAEEDYIPAFTAVIASGNMLDRPAGFVCRSSAGRVVRLIQPYEVGRVIRFLASEDAVIIRGQSISVDGGNTRW